MRYFKTPAIIAKTFKSIWWKLPQEKPTIFLTFDDGPIPELTPYVLETLQKFQAKATFFCVGDNIRKHPDIFQNLLQYGHQVGNHTFNHLNAWKVHKNEYLQNIALCQQIMQEQNVQNTLFRPPYGKLSLGLRKQIEKNLKIVLWDVLTYDFDQTLDQEICLKNALQNTENGSIVVFHDNIKAIHNLTYTLPRFLEYFSEKGFCFEALPSAETKSLQSSLQ